ncbi:hypothetical protein AAG570_003173 [Ranatra chinensis]|uniref:MD-2-related lipid-recognition domain-containing protein n=1 Tax=Ranatra chinensis TaxID=642074 RepID=A0ABD0YID7_9HEMI
MASKRRNIKVSIMEFLYPNWFRLIAIISGDNAEFFFAVFGNGGWKSNYHQLNLEKVCADAKALFPTTSASFFRAIGQNDCPFPAGNYTLKNFPVQLKVNIPVLPYNKYRVDGFLKRKGKRYTCVRIFVDVIPKKKPFHSN